MLHKITSKNFIFDYDRYNMIFKLKTLMHTHRHCIWRHNQNFSIEYQPSILVTKVSKQGPDMLMYRNKQIKVFL